MRIGQRFRQLLTDIENEAAFAAPALGPIKLTFEPEEIETLAMAARTLVRQGDPALSSAALTALTRLREATPPAAHRHLGLAPDYPSPFEARDTAMTAIGQSLRQRKKLRIAYQDAYDNPLNRTVWPVAVAIFDHARVLAAWCELRDDWRHFRLDRMLDAHVTGDQIPKGRMALLTQWRGVNAGRWEQALVT
jgi:predicted DNA-binding transcriptional regulator YafY